MIVSYLKIKDLRKIGEIVFVEVYFYAIFSIINIFEVIVNCCWVSFTELYFAAFQVRVLSRISRPSVEFF